MTFDAVVDRILAMFDTDQPTAVSFVNERHKRMIGEAEFRLAEHSLGNTVAGQSDYALADTVEHLRYLLIGADTEPYIRASEMQMLEIRSGRSSVEDAPGAFSMYFDSAGVEKVRINPTPSTSGTAIFGLAAIDPGDLTYGSSAVLLIPAHLHTYLLDGAIADGYEQVDNRWDLAAPHEQRYEVGIQKSRRFKNARLGSGPTRITRGW